MLLHIFLMKNRGINSYMAIAIGGLTLTVVGLSIVSYTRFRKRRSEKKGIERRSVESDEKLKASIQQDMVAT